MLVVRWAEGPPVALSGGRDAGKTGLDLSPAGRSCRGRICAPGGGQRAGGWLHSPPGSGLPPLCGCPAQQQSTDGYEPRFLDQQRWVGMSALPPLSSANLGKPLAFSEPVS